MQITEKQAEVFEHVAKQLALGESPSSTSIAMALVSEPSRAGHLVKGLVKLKLLERTPSKRLKLTKTGKARAHSLCISPAGSATEERECIIDFLTRRGLQGVAEQVRNGTQWERAYG